MEITEGSKLVTDGFLNISRNHPRSEKRECDGGVGQMGLQDTGTCLKPVESKLHSLELGRQQWSLVFQVCAIHQEVYRVSCEFERGGVELGISADTPKVVGILKHSHLSG